MLTKKDRRSIKSTAAILLTLFYIINVQSVSDDVPKQMARQDELEITVQNTNKQLAY